MNEINYFGMPYSFTHIAALKRFGNKHKYISNQTIEGTIKSMNSDCSIGVIPIENTYGGIITDSVDILCSEEFLESNLIIKEELELKIKLFLLGKNGINPGKIRKIYSHEYPLKISAEWIKENLYNTDVNAVASTSEACMKIRKERYSCAIASYEAAEHYNLKKLEEIEIKGKNNITRFFVLGNKKMFKKFN